jgi:hypothetical protein
MRDLQAMPPASLPAQPRRLLLLLAATAIIVRWLFQAITGVTFEDSLISLRYAENLVSGLGMVYNPGERVFGASTPLYVLLLALFTRFGLPALLAAKTLAAVADGVTLYLWGQWLLRRTGQVPAVLFFGLLFGLSPVMVHVSTSGMETSFALLLLSLALLGAMEDRPNLCGVTLGLLMLVRPDGAVAALILLGFRWWLGGRLPWKPALIAAAIVLPWLLVATWYYGSPVPHSIPAKVAAYNLHRRSFLHTFSITLGQVAPVTAPWKQWFQFVTTLVVFPGLALGMAAAWRTRQLRVLPLFLLIWWAYLILPNTLVFIWYLPLLLMPAYLLSALGFAAWLGEGQRRGERESGRVGEWGKGRVILPHTHTPPHPLTPSPSRRLSASLLGVLAAAIAGWLVWIGIGAYRVQRAEEQVRRGIGLWLRQHTPEDTRVAMEPIGYIGYYSRRRVLDEVGLVSPAMVPVNRAGAGWFAEMLRRLAPEYVVERPGYLLRNRTLNTLVPMFRSAAEREAFLTDYEAVAAYGSTDVPKHLIQDYRFVIYRRRSPQNAGAWRQRWSRLPARERGDLNARALMGPVALTLPVASGPALPRQH